MPDTKLLIALDRKKLLSSGGAPMVACYHEIGDVRLYNDGCVVLGEHSFGPKVEIDFVFGVGFAASREKGSRTLLITPPDGEETLEFVHRGVWKGWAKLVPFHDEGYENLEARFGERFASIAYYLLRLYRQIA